MTAPHPRIAIAICSYERYDVLPTAIDSAIRQTLDDDAYKIFVIDNSPDHERAKSYAAQFKDIPNLTYVLESTPGLSNARNAAMRICETEFISFMDDDAIASPVWLERILEAFDAHGEKTKVVGGRVKPLWGAPRPPWLHDSLLGYLSVVDWGAPMRIASVDEWFAGTNISFRTRVALECGGFSTMLGRVGSGASLMSNEEKELLERISAIGGQFVYAPEAYVDHLVAPERLTHTWFRKRAAWQAVSDFTMIPNKQSFKCASRWKDTMRYFGELPPHERTIRGFVFDTDDPNLFHWQLGAIYTMTMMTLAGFEGAGI